MRTGFQSLQLIVTDYLQLLPPVCLPVCVDSVGQYGLQCQDINISLTSIGQLVSFNNNNDNNNTIITIVII